MHEVHNKTQFVKNRNTQTFEMRRDIVMRQWQEDNDNDTDVDVVVVDAAADDDDDEFTSHVCVLGSQVTHIVALSLRATTQWSAFDSLQQQHQNSLLAAAEATPTAHTSVTASFNSIPCANAVARSHHAPAHALYVNQAIGKSRCSSN